LKQICLSAAEYRQKSDFLLKFFLKQQILTNFVDVFMFFFVKS